MARTCLGPVSTVKSGLGGTSWGLVTIGNEIFVGTYENTSIIVLDATTLALKRTLAINYSLSIGTDGTNLYAKNASSQIMTIDKNTGAILSTKTNVTFVMGSNASFRIDTVADRIYYCDYNSNFIIKKYSDGTIIKSYSLTDNYTSGVTFIGDRICVSIYANNNIYLSSSLSTDGELGLKFSLLYHHTAYIIGVTSFGNNLYFTTYSATLLGSTVYTTLGNQVNSFTNMAIGDYIPCRYTAGSGIVGAFTELGTCNDVEISRYGTATPNGLFYFIHSGYDAKGRMKLIADRNIQHSISYDKLNSGGMTDEIQINTDVFVNCLTGNDNNDGSSANPLQTIKTAIVKALPSSTIILSSGVHSITTTNGSLKDLVTDKFLKFIGKGESTIIEITNNASLTVVSNNIGATFCNLIIRPSNTYTGDTRNLWYNYDGCTVNFINFENVVFSKSLNGSYPTDRVFYFGNSAGTVNYPATFKNCSIMAFPNVFEAYGYSKSKINCAFGNTNALSGATVTNCITGATFDADYRVTSANNGSGVYYGTYDWNLVYNYVNPNYVNKFIRLLTGGVFSGDLDNEWDNIIVNDNLNGKITPGDSNVWHWSSIYSVTSTAVSGASVKTRRGSTSLNTWDNLATNYVDTGTGFRPVLIIESLNIPPTFSGQVSNDTVHTEDIRLTGSISDDGTVGYKILLNDVQLYPTTGYTDLAVGPIGVDYLITNNNLIVGANKITIKLIDNFGATTQYDLNTTVYNTAPTGVLTLSTNTVHGENVEVTGTLSDAQLDAISYRILVNGVESLTWTGFTEDPIIDYTLINSDLNIGNNNLTVEFIDNFKGGMLGSWSQTITKTNGQPTINMQMNNGLLTATIDDPDHDSIQYQIIINGIQKFPIINNSNTYNTPCNINYAISRDDIIVGQNNTLTLQAEDGYGGSISQNITFIGEYIGIMFMDENREYYTSDVGQLLRYLDFGTITLGQTTEPQKVILKNQYGFDVATTNLTIINNLNNITVELCKVLDPFVPTNILTFEEGLINGEEKEFYVRLATTVSTVSVDGEFEIVVKAQPI